MSCWLLSCFALVLVLSSHTRLERSARWCPCTWLSEDLVRMFLYHGTSVDGANHLDAATNLIRTGVQVFGTPARSCGPVIVQRWSPCASVAKVWRGSLRFLIIWTPEQWANQLYGTISFTASAFTFYQFNLPLALVSQRNSRLYAVTVRNSSISLSRKG